MKKTKFLLLAGLMCAFSLVFAPLTQALTLREQVQAACENIEIGELSRLVSEGANFAESDAKYAKAIRNKDRNKILALSKEKHEFWNDDVVCTQVCRLLCYRSRDDIIMPFDSNKFKENYFNSYPPFDEDYLNFLLDNHILNPNAKRFNELLTIAAFKGSTYSLVRKIKELKPDIKPYLPTYREDTDMFLFDQENAIWKPLFNMDYPDPDSIISCLLDCGANPDEILMSFCYYYDFEYLTNCCDNVVNYGVDGFEARKSENYLQRIMKVLSYHGANFNQAAPQMGVKTLLDDAAINCDKLPLAYLLLRNGAKITDHVLYEFECYKKDYYFRKPIQLIKMVKDGKPLPDSYFEFLKLCKDNDDKNCTIS